jgi:hypothetical protein
MKLEDILRHKKFVEFLKKHGAYEIYVKNFDESFADGVIYYVTDYIDYAFGWRGSEQGYQYWQNVEEEWKKESKSKLEKYLNAIDTESQDVVE